MVYFLLFVLPNPAAAHGLDAHRMQVELDGRTVRVAVTPGVDAFPSADTNGDARLDRAEVATAREAIRTRVVEAIELHDGAGQSPACDPASVSTVGNGEDHVRISLRCTFPSPPDTLEVKVGALGFAPFTFEGLRSHEVRPGTWAPDGPVVRATVPVGGGIVRLAAPGVVLETPSPSPGEVNWPFGVGAIALAGSLLLARTLRARARSVPPLHVESPASPRDPLPPA